MKTELRPLDELVTLSTASATQQKSGRLPYIGLEHIEAGQSRLLGLASSSDSVSVNFTFRSGDILFGKLRPNLRKSVRVNFDGYCSTDLLVLRPNDGVDSSFAGWVMRSDAVFSEAVRTSEGTKMPRTSWSRLKNLVVRVPSLGEQRRIAEILDALDKRIDLSAEEIDKHGKILEGLGQSLIPVLPDVVAMGDEWEVVPLAEVVPSADYGISTPLVSDAAGIPTLRMGNLVGGDIDVNDIKYTMEPVSDHLKLRRRDVLFNRTNSIEHVGRTSIWRGELEDATFASYLVRLNVYVERVLPE